MEDTSTKKLYYGYIDFVDEGIPFYIGIGSLKRVKDMRRNKRHTRVAKKYGQYRAWLETV